MTFIHRSAIGIVLMSAISPTGPRHLQAQEVRVPMQILEGRPVVEVMIGSHGPFPFVFDTGAGATVLNADLVSEIGLEGGNDVLLADPAGGDGTPGKTHTLPILSIGGRDFSGVFAVSWNESQITEGLGGARGVLGVASLAGVVVDFDFGSLQIRIHENALGEGDGSIPYADPQMVIPSVTLRVGGQEINAHLDTGNGRGVGLPASLESALTFSDELVTDTARTASGSFLIRTGRLSGSVAFGGVTVQNPLVFLNERFPVGNIGSPAFDGLILSVDVSRRRVRIWSH